MRVRIPADSPLDRPMIVLEADNDLEIVWLRGFADACHKAGGTQIGSHGGNPSEHRYSINLIPRYPSQAAPPRREPLTPEQIAEAQDMLPKVGEREDCYCSVKGSTLRALMGAAGITPDKGSEPPKEQP